MTECGGAMTLTLPGDPFELTSTTAGQPKWAGGSPVSPNTAVRSPFTGRSTL